ncbi:MAG: hypothetical protein NDI82_11390 [Anaeromyxobacteraceae bacterium]|nr:hypothetical protein [Anaeromyxobacteraceae bacterium]
MIRSGRAPAVVVALALLGAAAAYGAALDGDFHLDDGTTVLQHWRIRSPSRVLDIRALELLGPARPIAELSLALDDARGGLAPQAYHLTSLLLHLATALLVLALARDAWSGAATRGPAGLPVRRPGGVGAGR